MTTNEIINPANLVYRKTPVLTDTPMHYCPGCSHGVVHKLLAEVIEEMGIQEKAIGIAPVGCAVFAYNYIDIDWQQAAHGRAPALATAIKRLLPDKYVFTYQGDGDLAAIGTVADVAPLIGENRSIVKRALKQMRSCWYKREGVKALYDGDLSRITAEDIAFRLAPCINAPGRLDYRVQQYISSTWDFYL